VPQRDWIERAGIDGHTRAQISHGMGSLPHCGTRGSRPGADGMSYTHAPPARSSASLRALPPVRRLHGSRREPVDVHRVIVGACGAIRSPAPRRLSTTPASRHRWRTAARSRPGRSKTTIPLLCSGRRSLNTTAPASSRRRQAKSVNSTSRGCQPRLGRSGSGARGSHPGRSCRHVLRAPSRNGSADGLRAKLNAVVCV